MYSEYRSMYEIYEVYAYNDYIDPDVLAEMRIDIVEFLMTKNYTEKQINDNLNVHFTSNQEKDKYKIVAYNTISALWMSNVFPNHRNLEIIESLKEYENNENIYKYNSKTKLLKVIIK